MELRKVSRFQHRASGSEAFNHVGSHAAGVCRGGGRAVAEGKRCARHPTCPIRARHLDPITSTRTGRAGPGAALPVPRKTLGRLE
jgi:hypothetical protein